MSTRAKDQSSGDPGGSSSNQNNSSDRPDGPIRSPSKSSSITTTMPRDNQSRRVRSAEEESIAADGHDDPPPPYSAVLGQISESNDNSDTNAAIASDGRVNIRINQSSKRASSFLSNLLKSSVGHDETPPPEPYIPPSLGGSPDGVPPPMMNVVIHVVGSRGDVQPFVALGKVLQDTYGHRVRLATHPTFKEFVQENGLEFFSIGGDPAELMAFMVKNPGLMPGFDAMRSGDIGQRRKGIGEMIRGCWRSCFEAGDGSGVPVTDKTVDEWFKSQNDPGQMAPEVFAASQGRPFVADCIIANPPSFAHIHCAERLGIPLHVMFTMPWSPTKAFPHPLANIVSSNVDPTVANYYTYTMVEMLTWQGLGDVINKFRVHDLGLEPMSLIWAPGTLQRLKIPHTYCWSPALIPKPADWKPHISISGFFFLSLASNYTPDRELAEYLDAGPPPVYIGFGSIVVDDPNAMTKLIFDAVKLTGQRALVSKGWGGFGADRLGIPDGVYMLGNVPHDWLFHRVSCVVHHGGAGTTAAGIACGKPTVIVPFFGDQPFWGNMVAKAGAGPTPIPHQNLTAQNLADAINTALKPSSLERAKELAQKITTEDGNQKGAQYFHQMLPLDRMRCSLYPEKQAVWRVKRTQILLSAKAAYLLYMKEVITWDDIKLHRPEEHEADIGPTDPISGGTAALLGTVTTTMMGVADMPIETLKALHIHPETREKIKAKAREASFSRKGKSHDKDKSDISLLDTNSSDSAKGDASTSQSSLVTSPTAMSPLVSQSNLSPQLSKHNSETASLQTMTTGTSTQFEPLSQKGSARSSVLLSTPLPSGPTSPAPQSSDSYLSIPESETTERGRSSTRRPSSMADALHALNDSSASPSRFRAKSRSSSISQTSDSGSPSRKPHRSNTISSKYRSASQSISSHIPLESGSEYTLDTLYGTSKGIGRIIGAGLRSPMDFTMALSKGFHNLPRVYGEEPRQVDRVTDLGSGFRTAGKEFGQGMFDGIAGLVTQPLQGAKKEGAAGFFKGVGRGIAGVAVKPAAAIYALPAYAMMGFYKEIQKRLGSGVATYILSARIAQGFDEWMRTDEEQREEAVVLWGRTLAEVKGRRGIKDGVVAEKGNYMRSVKGFVDKQKEKRRLKKSETTSKVYPSSWTSSASSSTSKHHLSVPDPAEAQRPGESATTLDPATAPAAGKGKDRGKEKAKTPDLAYESDENDRELEEVLRLSMRMEPRKSDDAAAETRHSIQQSLEEMRDVDEQHDDQLFLAKQESRRLHEIELQGRRRRGRLGGEHGGEDGGGGDKHDDDLKRAIEASQKSLGVSHEADTDEELRRALDESRKEGHSGVAGNVDDATHDHELRLALEESQRMSTAGNGNDEDLSKAMEESKRIADEEERRQREEEIVMEYVRKQSLAEQSWKGKAGSSS